MAVGISRFVAYQNRNVSWDGSPTGPSKACRRPVLRKIVRHETQRRAMDLFTKMDDLKRQWTDQYVTVKPERPELKRFIGIVGRVVTVNYNGRALIDFQDGGWYDVAASEEYLNKLDAAEGKTKYKK